MEDIQRQRSHESIAQGILLIQVSADSARLLVPPGTPLINKQTNLSLRVFLVHDSLVFLNHLFNLQAFS